MAKQESFKTNIAIVRELGATRAFALESKHVMTKVRESTKTLVIRRYRTLDALLKSPNSLPQDFPAWMKKDGSGAIMIHPGTPVKWGYAITKEGTIRKVPSVVGIKPKSSLVSSQEHSFVLNEIISYWARRRARARITKP